jgi:hypothetical protein
MRPGGERGRASKTKTRRNRKLDRKNSLFQKPFGKK